MVKKYDVILFTDMSGKLYPARPLGAYRLATELRQNNISVLVVNFTSKWLQNLKDFDKLIKSCISKQTFIVGFSSTFFSYNNGSTEIVKTWQDFHGTGLFWWPHKEKNKIKILINQIKKRNSNIKIFYGGGMADRLTDEIRDVGIDYVVQGLADKSFLESVLRIKQNKSPKFNFKNGFRVIDYDITGSQFDFPSSVVNYHESDIIQPNEVLSLETSRGCLFHCAFCAFPLLGRNKNHPEYHKVSSNISQEISENYKKWNVRKYMIVDDTFNESTQKLNLINDAIKQSGVDIEFSAYLRLDLLERFPEQIQLLKDMGLRSGFLGIETLNEQAGKAIGKNSYRVIEILEKIREVWKDDIVIHGSLIAGLPQENQDTINEWMEWLFNKKHLLDNYFIGALDLNKYTSSPSKITQDPQKYGYVFDPTGKWINNINFTQDEATELSNYWMTKGWETGRLKLAGWDIMGIQNLGYSFCELKQYASKDLDYTKIQKKYFNIVEDYKTSLIQYLNT